MENKNKMIVILGLMAFLANGDNYAAAPLIINIAADLNLTVSVAAMSVTAYMLAFGVFTLIFGPLSDRFGKVKIINIAAIGTAIFSVLGAFAFNLPSLIFFRATNGAFGAGIFPVTLALVGQSFDDQNRQKAIAKVMGLMFLGGATATIIGGALAYFGSWRFVYLVYGITEFIIAMIMLKTLERDQPVVERLNIFEAYKEPLSNFSFMKLVMTIFFVGFSVFGSFTYTGKLIQTATGYNLLVVGLILSLFGVGTVVGGRIAPALRKKLKSGFLVSAGIIGGASLLSMAVITNAWLLSLALFGFGMAFIFLQSTLITTVQEKLPKRRGTAMSLASFNMFVGGAVGTSINAMVIETGSVTTIYISSAVILFLVSIVAALFISQFEVWKRQQSLEEN
ncbi:MFS transporter [Acetobacterium malicum]|uniref:MFS transporter n=1 Tax=Acetobacterium malicum TaxID=52692 RepID=UPI00042A82C2|nr:MFS transporter [Acetobacterium dehalogenans]